MLAGALRPGDRLHDRPAARTVAVETELPAEAIEAIKGLLLRVAELTGTDDRRDRELPLGSEWLRIDHEPRLALRRKDVLPVKVLVNEDELALRRRQLSRQGTDLALQRPVVDLVGV